MLKSASLGVKCALQYLGWLLPCTVGLIACSIVVPQGTGSEAVYRVSDVAPSARVTVDNSGDSALLEVHSSNGIGRATVHLVEGQWPPSILMRFHLQGLESLEFQYGDRVVYLSATTQGLVLRATMSESRREEVVDSNSAYWMPLRFVNSEYEAVESLEAGGAIEVGVPADFIDGDFSEFTIKWIDFYR